MDGAVPLLEAQATAIAYTHDVLPGPRCIRVLVLQPAGNLEDPLVGSFETVWLGDPLPSEPESSYGPVRVRSEAIHEKDLIMSKRQNLEVERNRAHYKDVISSRSLYYDAVSYTWATENGDASLSHFMLLNGLRLNITKNLAEGLRRLRSRIESKQLWIDAVCINQCDLTERSSQVAIMFDIYRLARNLIVWLGEGTFPEEDRIVWQLTKCISDADRPMPHDYIVLNWSKSMIQEAIDAFLNTEMCKTHPFRVIESCCGIEEEQHTCHMSSAEPATNGPCPGQWLAAECPKRLRLVVGLEALLSLLERRYWTRRWVLQENFARLSFSGTVRFHWGRYSADARLFRGALRMARPLLWRASGISYSASVAYDQSIQFVLRIVEPASHSDKRDLLERIIQFRHLNCAEPRDRLYSLLPLVPGHRLQADYTATFETVCSRFAKSMMEAGDMRVLYHAGDANDYSSITLPSWAPDLRGYYAQKTPVATLGMTDTRHCVSVDKSSLVMMVYWIGDIVDGSSHYDSDQGSWVHWYGDIRRYGDTLDVRLIFETRSEPVPGEHDILCMLDIRPLYTNMKFLWLRAVDSTRSTYRLIVSGEHKTMQLYSMTGFEKLLKSDFESLRRSKISVTII
ncbi:hypothetical protein CKM354_000914100 [Cercospora kikuchii]|uniref:Heterokaryon incompatibility domain-containing protein n=1 Tax=Cercospora kikuchii TaxID=84275 RepID=A0A9P3CNH4_9PEZI|nr:uncharacterized protein CKM354_000914100 [Cercospora kikuchii]GIZ45998.1 hypothetical protein CKM354_000914100 [Cercospora kikuchii]